MIHPNLTYREYAALEGVNWSRLKAMRVSPRQFHYELTNPPDSDSPHFRIGVATHAQVLEPETFRERFCCYKGTRRGKAWEAAKALSASQNLAILSEEEAEAVAGAAAAVLTNPYAAAILGEGLREVSITWEDEETRFDCKGRADFAGDRLVDLKTAARIDPRAYAAQATRLGYHAQFAFYLDGLRANGLSGGDRDPVMFVVQSAMPHDTIIYTMPPHVIDAGRAEYRRLLRRLYECAERDEWPGIASGPVVFELPRWAYDSPESLEPAELEDAS